MTKGKKIFWWVFSILIISCNSGIAYFFGKTTYEYSALFGGKYIFFEIVSPPLLAAFVVFQFYPLLIRNRWVISGLATIALAGMCYLGQTMIPVTFFWPQAGVWIFFNLIFLICGTFLIYPLGKLMAEVMEYWLIAYKSPATVIDAVDQAPTNVVSSVKVDLSRKAAGGILAVFWLIGLVIGIKYPRWWGLGVYELKSSFPDQLTYQTEIYKKFFAIPLDNNYTVTSFNRKPTISICWHDLPEEVKQGYAYDKPVITEIGLTNSQFEYEIGISQIDYGCELETSGTLTKARLGEVTKYKLAQSYFSIAYPGGLREGDRINKINTRFTPDGRSAMISTEDAYQRDQNRVWLRKGDTVVCGVAADSNQEKELISVLEAVRANPLETSNCSPTTFRKHGPLPEKVLIEFKKKWSEKVRQEQLANLRQGNCRNISPDKPEIYICIIADTDAADSVIFTAKSNSYYVQRAERWFGE